MEYLPGARQFLIGCNYWSSESGLHMWKHWSEEVVDRDFAAMAAHGMNTVRVFPLWEDFQPVKWDFGFRGSHDELVMPSGKPLPKSGPEHYGLDPVMLSRFRCLADLAEKHGLKVIVGLLTGWMSGGFFAPPAVGSANVFTDPEALKLETLFLRGFVEAMKDHPAIIAWEPGNECNCMSLAENAATSWNWLNMVASTVRLSDPSRPVYAGMHGCSNLRMRPWNLFVLGELMDALTTHPYPKFTPCCGRSALNTIPAIFHATAETLYYSGASGRPAFIEEIGAFGPGYLDAERTEAYLHAVLWSAYAHGLPGVLWWCAFAFDKCATVHPYRAIAMERDLGALSAERVPAGAAKAMARFQKEITDLPFESLPPRQVDCMVITTLNENMWQAAYGAFILGTQAGISVEYCDVYALDELPKANFYIVPSIVGFCVMPFEKYRQLLAAAEEGATVCFTAASGMLQPFVEPFGCQVSYCAEKPSVTTFSISGIDGEFTVNSPYTRRLKANGCEVHGTDTEGNPVLISKAYGKGRLVYLNAPIENEAITETGRLHLIYRKLAEIAGVTCPEKSPEIGVTRHIFPDGRTLRISINYADYPADGMPANSVKTEWA